ncbi:MULTISPECIES: PAAR domain-containing protein [Rubrivivax]|uniref:PAAR domain-containing protein n=1 Tax=Rubrivivax benzoatilyticus TaxID=316997 RepID=A0ABX0I237_9BURK|nr:MULTISPECIES: PAAR domain-containing protein [Rubrivivax]EGJ09145.1 PAAR protein [Rubrivivax benzoatilyticus JA2 = ATCC BAA-35]MCD0417904.1 PAAR domain-containing protein [Rubrivivax sp. JA1024]NHK99684.1 PAAR domain-containing protein [Rubrivivax benzoatilyticus]NHL25557.1 PAAR domain-containing protein [Rubrivivax benzoatilyticus]
MSRAYVRVGDRTSHGGVVLAGSPNTELQGRAVARVGDPVSCPRKGHGQHNRIVSGDPRLLIDGQPAAREGDRCACGARLLASQTTAGD